MTLNIIEYNNHIESNSEKFSFKYEGIPANNNIDNENIQKLQITGNIKSNIKLL